MTGFRTSNLRRDKVDAKPFGAMLFLNETQFTLILKYFYIDNIKFNYDLYSN